MRPGISRVIAGALLAGVTLLAASACTKPPGTDGDLVNQWPAFPAPAGWEPKAGACTNDFAATLYRTGYQETACDKTHKFETVHIGQFTGNATAMSSPPSSGSPELKEAWVECDKKTTEFLGGQWREGRIWLGVSLPSPGNWSGGARWFRCEASAIDELRGSPISWSKSLKGEFAASTELRYGCFTYESGKAKKEVACTAPHNTEFAGAVQINEVYSKLKDVTESLHQKCRSAIAAYVGVPDDGNMKYRTGTVLNYPDENDWAAGDNSIRCHIWLNKNVSRSLKGTGNGGLPIN